MEKQCSSLTSNEKGEDYTTCSLTTAPLALPRTTAGMGTPHLFAGGLLTKPENWAPAGSGAF